MLAVSELVEYLIAEWWPDGRTPCEARLEGWEDAT